MDQTVPAELARRIRAGDSDAEHEMVQRYSRGVGFLLRELTGDAARADDLHQETFSLLLAKVRAGEVREPDKLNSFVRNLDRFYRRLLRDGMRPAAALRAAQREVLEDPELADPYHCAAFAIYGDWR